MSKIEFTGGGGFTLPVVVIASVVMLAVLLLALQIASITRQSLEDQYYNQLAREAAEAGGVYIGSCLDSGGSYTSSMVVRPNTNCSGANLSPARSQYITETSRVRSTYFGKYTTAAVAQTSEVLGTVELLSSSGGIQKTYTYSSRQQLSQEIDPNRSRPNKRWWFFGLGARLDFGITGSPNPVSGVTSGAAGSAYMQEGTTVVSGGNSGLLFFSDGLSVWDMRGDLMPLDGTSGDYNYTLNCDLPSGVAFPYPAGSQRLCGSNTATQAVAAFPMSKAKDRFIIVSNTANAINEKHWGSLYATYVYVPHATNATGALGFRNWPVWDGQKNYTTEALNARPSLDGKGAVIYAYQASSPRVVRAFKIWSDNDGWNMQRAKVAEVSVALSPETICASGTPPAKATGFGSINFNTDYTRMIVMMGGNACGDSRNAGTLHLFDISGSDNNMRLIASWRVGAPSSGDVFSLGYSADFSPSGQYVYASKIYPGQLYRYDISSGNATTIKSTERFIGKTNCVDYSKSILSYNNGSTRTDACVVAANSRDGGGQVLRGPDNKMYVADRGARHVSRVLYPDAANGSTDAATASNVGWRYADVVLSAGTLSYYGLPQMVTLYSPRLLQY